MIRAAAVRRRLFRPTVAATGWGESTFAELAWDRSRGAAARWGAAGAVLGVLAALLAFAPATWLAGAVAAQTGGRVLLADARGTVWSGSAVAVLSGGAGSRDARSLPGRLSWTLRPHGLGFEMKARHACCINDTATLRLAPGFGRLTATLLPTPGWIAQWPSALLSGLGTPYNTLQLGGSLRFVSPGLTLESVQGRWRLDGRAELELIDVASALSPLDPLGSYRVSLAGDPGSAGTAALELTTLQGVLRLNGSGSLGPGGMRFRGEARAAGADSEPALANLLNIIGRRSGARSVISIG